MNNPCDFYSSSSKVMAKFELKTIISLVLILLAGPVLAQSITVPTESVAKGSTANVTLSFVAGGGATNLDFAMSYDETVVDESAIVVVCDADLVGLDVLNCSVNTTTNEILGIGVNFSGEALV